MQMMAQTKLTPGELATLKRLSKKDGSRLTDNVMALIRYGFAKTRSRSERRLFKRRGSSLNGSLVWTDVTTVYLTDAGRRYLQKEDEDG